MNHPLFLKGVFKEKIWGGKKLKPLFDYDIPSDNTGELWAISAHKNGASTVLNGPYKGKQLDELWANHKELFGDAEGDVFPLLTKIIDAQTDLSVQVHPDDVYGKMHENELGKTECWYIIDAEEGSEIVYGHHAQSKEELVELINNGQWDKLLRKKEVKAGDFFYVPSGTIHAIGGGIVILETQQSSDTTYRVYDYDRIQDNGETRDLHIEDSVAVTSIPHTDPNLEMTTINKENHSETILVSNSFFTVKEWKIDGHALFKKEGPYTLVSVLNGEGTLNVNNESYAVSKGDHFILPHSIESWSFNGALHVIASYPGNN
ncbi:MAG: mannose-6-phosphate isomerase, class I [Alkalibacterium sp.]|uniref:Mannose-6-phosphate isomerase n=2 Tax=Alkalibacterium gilvum TaxID=1130080 RepID=A0A1H6TAG6_9LACT|nr:MULTISPECIES: mannose-6-phosphate isomerase, class I [Alkalibacterium]MDN6296216.1 mannose-6-phosphate isomerase, class I [Alkalibacterium sp.]MDN6326424.1 mannose-6-phosphate isomerase, class I [Alkalibacterium sp.]SEI76266.1 mannose-6-phosphate isomerase, type 1 [Alkalibacterium gilvum]HAJ69691.1 mannose-6-phosphate isomerase, class I [Alkalibacterium sp.]